MDKPAILWIADSLTEDAGTERQVIDLSRWIRTRLDLHVATFRAHEPRVSGSDITFRGFPLEGALWSADGMRQMTRMSSWIRSRKIQVVHGFMPKSSLAASIAGMMSGAPVVLASRRNLGYHYTAKSLMLTRLLNLFVTRIVANSQAAKEAAVEREGFPADKVDVIYNGVDLEKFRPAGPESQETGVPIPPGKKIVGIVANYRPVKNLELFLRAAAIVAHRVPDACFLLAGSGKLESSLRLLAGELGIAERVIFTSGKGAVLPYLQLMSVGCLCSSSEGFSNSILEYMAAGLPVVATEVGGNAEAVQHGETGFLVREFTPEAFAGPIIRLLEDQGLRLQMGRSGLERCHSEFEMNHAARRLAKYYEGLLGKPSATSATAGAE